MDIITITPAATEKLNAMLAAQDPKPEAVLVSVTTKGCSGMRYDLQFLPKLADAPKFADKIEQNGVTILVDPKASIYLVGTTMDYREDSLRSGFDFLNPNETARCGCGESFSVDKAD